MSHKQSDLSWEKTSDGKKVKSGLKSERKWECVCCESRRDLWVIRWREQREDFCRRSDNGPIKASTRSHSARFTGFTCLLWNEYVLKDFCQEYQQQPTLRSTDGHTHTHTTHTHTHTLLDQWYRWTLEPVSQNNFPNGTLTCEL